MSPPVADDQRSTGKSAAMPLSERVCGWRRGHSREPNRGVRWSRRDWNTPPDTGRETAPSTLSEHRFSKMCHPEFGVGHWRGGIPPGAAARIVTIGKVRCTLQSDLIVVFSDLVFINRLRDACLPYPWDIWRRMGEVCFGTGGTRGSDGGWMIVPPPPAPPPRWSLVRLAGRVSRERGDDGFDL